MQKNERKRLKPRFDSKYERDSLAQLHLVLVSSFDRERDGSD